MRNALLAAGICLLFCTQAPLFASPTVVGLNAENAAGTASIYTDTTNQNILWVTPPSNGELQINRESFAIDEPTCESVASLYRTRRSMAAQLEVYNLQIESIQTAIFGIIQSASDNPGDSADEVADRITAWSDLLEYVTTKRNETTELMKDDAITPHLLEGAGYYAIIAYSGWQSALETVRHGNPGKVVNAINTSSAKLNVSVVGADGFEPNELIANVHVKNAASMESVSDELQIDVEPTKIGACFMRYPQVVVGIADPYAFGISVNYEHPLALSTNVDAVYNLKNVYDLLIQSGRSGGFFSRKSYRNTIENRALTEAFHLRISFDEDVTEEQKRAEENRVKEFLLGYAVSQMTATVGEAGTLGKSGALIASEELVKACGANGYCQGIAAALRVLDGIFGRSRSSARVTQTLSVTKSYSSKVVETIAIPRTISYTWHGD